MDIWRAFTRWNSDYLFLDSAQVDVTEVVAAKQAALLRQQYADGKITDAELAQWERYAAGIGYDNIPAADSPAGAFVGSIAETLTTNPLGGVKDALNWGAGSLLKAIPWWLWLVGAGYLAWRLGLLKRMKFA